MSIFARPFIRTQETKTGEVYTDAAGLQWPVYAKKLATGALPNATSGNVAHGVSNIKLDAPFEVKTLVASSGTGGATARTNKNSPGMAYSFTATDVVITTSVNLSAQSGEMVILYCKTTDNP